MISVLLELADFLRWRQGILDTSIYEFAALSEQAVSAAAINSTCVVFAESEIVSLLAKGTPKESIIKGLHESIAKTYCWDDGNRKC